MKLCIEFESSLCCALCKNTGAVFSNLQIYLLICCRTTVNNLQLIVLLSPAVYYSLSVIQLPHQFRF